MRARSACHLWFAAPLALVALAAAPATAQEADTTLAPDDASAAARDAEARGLYEAGRAAFADTRFEDAFEYFERSHALSGRPELLYNIGLAAERAGRDTDAVDSYRAYLAALPDAENRRDVLARIEVLERRLAGDASGASTDASAATGGGGPDGAGIALVVGGGVIAITGAVLLGLAAADQSSLDGAPAGTAWSSLEGTASRIPVESGVGWAALGVGVACAALGGVLLGTSGSGSRTPDTVAVSLVPLGVRVEGSF